MTIYDKLMDLFITKEVHSKKDFSSIKVLNGENPNPSVLGRPILGVRDDLSKLDQAVQYIGRTSAMITTDNTAYVIHFDKTPEPEITNLEYVEVGQKDSYVSDDYRFNGNFASFVNAGNIMSLYTGLDSSLKSENGWTYSGNTDARCSFSYSENGLGIKNYLRKGAKSKSSLTIFPADKYVDVTTLPTPVISFLVKAKTAADVDLNKVKLSFGFWTCKADKTRVDFKSASITERSFTGILKLENVTYDPAKISFLEPVIQADFADTGAFINVLIKDFALVNAPYIVGYSRTSNAGTGLIYKNAVDTTSEQSTLYERIMFTKDYFRNTKKRFGAMFLKNDALNLELGALSTGTGLKLVLSKISDNTVVASSEKELTISDQCFGRYCACGIRFGKLINEIQLFFVDPDGQIDHVSLDFKASGLQDAKFDLCIGAYRDTVSDIEGQITEIRYDREWLNDQQICAATNCQLAFQSKDLSSLTSSTVYDILDAIEVNMIKNPDGRFNQYHWTGFPELAKFTNIVGNPQVGSGWKWMGGTSNQEIYITSEVVQINPNKELRFRSKVKSAKGSVGTYGICFKFFTDATGATQVGDTVFAYGKHGRDLEYIEATATPPEGALFASASMLIGADFQSVETYWTKLKLEQGEHSTMFTDDSSPKHALYAP